MTEYKYGLSEIENAIDEKISGLSDEPVVAVPVLRVVGSHATYYESRTFSNSGLIIVSKQRAPERAINQTIRPNSEIIEVGEYPLDDYDLINRILCEDGLIIHNGNPVNVENKSDYIGRTVQNKGLTRIVTHEQHPLLKNLAVQWGLNYRENIGKFEEMGTKSGLNVVLDKYRARHPNTPLGSFGTNFTKSEEVLTEINRLRSFGFGAYIKMDYSATGTVAAGGEGHAAFPKDLTDEQIMERFIKEFGYPIDGKMAGVVQMMIPNPKVFSISSGQNEITGLHTAYESHIQTVDGSTADGAMPLDNTRESLVLLQTLWPEVVQLFKEEDITGDANINCIHLPQNIHEAAKELYNNPNLASVVFVDFNYRGISGTKNAMQRYQEDTNRNVNFRNFRSKGIKVDRFYAANPHAIFAQAANIGLKSGKGGNFSLINVGTFNPPDFGNQQLFKTQVFVNQTMDPVGDVERLQAILAEEPTPRMLNDLSSGGYGFVDPYSVVSFDQDLYTEFLKDSMSQYLETIN